MQTTVSVLGMLEALHNVLLLQELVVLDCLVNSDDVLPDDTASTSIEVTSLPSKVRF